MKIETSSALTVAHVEMMHPLKEGEGTHGVKIHAKIDGGIEVTFYFSVSGALDFAFDVSHAAVQANYAMQPHDAETKRTADFMIATKARRDAEAAQTLKAQ